MLRGSEISRREGKPAPGRESFRPSLKVGRGTHRGTEQVRAGGSERHSFTYDGIRQLRRGCGCLASGADAQDARPRIAGHRHTIGDVIRSQIERTIGHRIPRDLRQLDDGAKRPELGLGSGGAARCIKRDHSIGEKACVRQRVKGRAGERS